MSRRAVCAGASLAGLLAAVACGSHPGAGSGTASNQVTLASGVTVLASADAADVTVLPGQLQFPAAAHGNILSLAPGSVLVGERAPSGLASQTNPRGFLRKVGSVASSNGVIVVTTTPASLLDVVHSGSFQSTLQVPSLGATGPVTQSASPSLRVQGLGGQPISLVDLSGKVLLHASGSAPVGSATPPDTVGYDALLQLTKATLDFTPSLDVGATIVPDLSDPLASLQEFHLIAKGSLAADLEVEAKLSLTGNPSSADVAQLIAQEIFQSTSTTLVDYPVDLGSIAIGPINMPATAEFKVTVACDQVHWGGTTDVVFGGTANATIQAGFQYSASGGLRPVYSHSENLGVVGPNWTLSDEVSAHCWIQPELDVSLFDVASGQLYAQAWGAMSADAVCDAQQKATGELQGTAFAGVEVVAQANVDVFGLFKWQKQCTLFAEETPHASVESTFALPAGSGVTCTTPQPDPAPVNVAAPPASCFGGGSGAGSSSGGSSSGSSSGGSSGGGDDAGTTGDDASAGDDGSASEAGDDGGAAEDGNATDGEDGGGACDHDVCTEGDALSATCTLDGQGGACIQSICANDPYCCTFLWSGSCVAHVTNGDFACTKRTCP